MVTKNNKILIDATYIQDESGLKKSVALYLFRFLDNYNAESSTAKFSILVRDSVYEWFNDRYGMKYSLIMFETKRLSRISFIQSVIDSLYWKHQVNRLNCDAVYIPFVWIYNSPGINKKKISTIHDLKPIREITTSYAKKISFFKPFILSVFRHFFKKALYTSDRIIAISEFVKQDVLTTFKRIDSDKVTVIYDGIKCDGFVCKSVPSLENKKFILDVNTIDEFKNTETLIRAYNLLNKEDLYLVLVGKETEYWNKICRPLCTQGVIRLDYVSQEELNYLYDNAYIFVTPSTKEGLGYTPVEAAVRDCPVISSRCEALPESTLESVFYYEDVYDFNALKNQIEHVIELKKDESFNDEIKKVGDKFRSHYSIDRFVKDIFNAVSE